MLIVLEDDLQFYSADQFVGEDSLARKYPAVQRHTDRHLLLVELPALVAEPRVVPGVGLSEGDECMLLT